MSLETLKTKVGLLIEKAQSGGTDEIEQIIDESGVLDSTDGTATEKVEQLIDKVSRLNWLKKETRTIGFRNNENITTLTLDCNNITHLCWLCYQMPNVESVHLTNTQNIKEWMYAFHTCPKLKVIETLDFSSVTVTLGWNHFHNISEVEVFKVVPETLKVSANFSFSSKLINESKQSIFDGLAPVTTAQTLTLHKDTKILQSQVDSANAKGWTVAGGTVVSEEEYYG